MIKDPTLPQLTGKEEQQIGAMMRGQKMEYRLRQWYDRFLHTRVPGLEDAPRAGAPLRFTVTQRCQVLAIACDKPENYGWKGQTVWPDTLTETVSEEAHDESVECGAHLDGRRLEPP